jgi:hypothetical protein
MLPLFYRPPSNAGPRKCGEGCEDQEQGILAAESTQTGGARLTITLLAAGFVIGGPAPSPSSLFL